MKLMMSTVGLVALLSMVAGCAGEGGRDEGNAADEDVGAAASAQIDIGDLVYTITQGGPPVASAWAGKVSGDPVEYWVFNGD